MRNIWVLFAVTLSLVSPPGTASPIPPEAIAALQAAQADPGLSITILRRYEGTEREEWVVLLGESHAKTKASSDRGKEVLRTFPGDIGIESVVHIDKYAGGKTLKYFSMPLLLGAARLLGFNQQSSAYDAKEVKRPNDHPVVYLEKGHNPDLAEHLFILHVNTSIAYTVVTNSVRAANGAYSLANLVRKVGFGGAGSEIFWWTVNAPWNGAKAVGGAFYKFGSCTLNACTLPVVMWNNGWRGNSAAVQDWFFQQFHRPASDPKKPWHPTYAGVKTFMERALLVDAMLILGLGIYSAQSDTHHWGIIDSRNETMVENLVEHIDNPENPPAMLAIAGFLHRPGIVKMLIARGFKPVSIEELSQELEEERRAKQELELR